MLKIPSTIFYIIMFIMGGGFMAPSFADENVKEPNVSGQFYDSNPSKLSSQIDQFFKKAVVSPSDKKIDIIISPHAGYFYSGSVAAYGYKAASKNKYSTIVILAPSHYFGFDGISIWEKGSFKTPFGVVDVDDKFSKELLSMSEEFIFEPRAFNREHSLEVQIPFLQKAFKDFKIVPIIMGQPDFIVLEDLAKALNKIIGDRSDVLIVASTDLSHFHKDSVARQIDKKAIETIENMDAEKIYKDCRMQTMEICGYIPVTAAILYAKLRGLTEVDVLNYANSSDASGDKSNVVGYASIIFYNDKRSDENNMNLGINKKINELSLEQKKVLLEIARDTIYEYIKRGKKLDIKVSDERFLMDEGAFVTLNKNGLLRGCIGNIIGRGPLYLTIRDMAIAASSADPRFPPVSEKELENIDINISILTKPKVITSLDEIILGKHGVIISRDPFHTGVFLPQVATETGWSKEQFLSILCSQKAGLPSDAWKDPKTKIEIFEAQVFSEEDLE